MEQLETKLGECVAISKVGEWMSALWVFGENAAELRGGGGVGSRWVSGKWIIGDSAQSEAAPNPIFVKAAFRAHGHGESEICIKEISDDKEIGEWVDFWKAASIFRKPTSTFARLAALLGVVFSPGETGEDEVSEFHHLLLDLLLRPNFEQSGLEDPSRGIWSGPDYVRLGVLGSNEGLSPESWAYPEAKAFLAESLQFYEDATA